MSSREFSHSSYPPFTLSPNSFPIASLATISLSSLLSTTHSLTAKTALFTACTTRGFFYLDLSLHPVGNILIKGSERLAHLAETAFLSLPQSEKDKYALSKFGTLFGYKHAGATVVDAVVGTRDTAEFWNISKDDMLSPMPTLPWPELILNSQDLIREYITASHEISMIIMRLLEEYLRLSPGSLTERHRLEEKSGDMVRLTRGPPRQNHDPDARTLECQTPSHTDFGSITILKNWLGGLQVWSESLRDAKTLSIIDPGKGEWMFVRPPPENHVIVNLGDAMVRFSGGKLCSGIHRVLPAPGDQGGSPRYSVVYFCRPEDGVGMRRVDGLPQGLGEEEGDGQGLEGENGEGRLVTAKEWILMKARALGADIGPGPAPVPAPA